MNDLEASRQLENRWRFIKQEAEEKANEIRVSAEEEFNLERLNLLEQEKAKIRKEYERREAQVEVKKKIEYSKQLNEQRIRVLSAREAAIQEIVTEAKLKLREVSKNPTAYKKLLTDLLVQALRKLGEKSATVKCRQVSARRGGSAPLMGGQGDAHPSAAHARMLACVCDGQQRPQHTEQRAARQLQQRHAPPCSVAGWRGGARGRVVRCREGEHHRSLQGSEVVHHPTHLRLIAHRWT